jgi:hypothetical protein
VNGAAPGLVLRRLVEHRGLLHLDDRTARQLAGDVRALADAAAVNAAELERHLALRTLRAYAVETELGPCVPLRLVEQTLADGAP